MSGNLVPVADTSASSSEFKKTRNGSKSVRARRAELLGAEIEEPQLKRRAADSTFCASGSNSSLVAPKQRHLAATMLPYPAVSKHAKVGGGSRVRLATPKELRAEVRELRILRKCCTKH